MTLEEIELIKNALVDARNEEFKREPVLQALTDGKDKEEAIGSMNHRLRLYGRILRKVEKELD